MLSIYCCILHLFRPFPPSLDSNASILCPDVIIFKVTPVISTMNLHTYIIPLLQELSLDFTYTFSNSFLKSQNLFFLNLVGMRIFGSAFDETHPSCKNINNQSQLHISPIHRHTAFNFITKLEVLPLPWVQFEEEVEMLQEYLDFLQNQHFGKDLKNDLMIVEAREDLSTTDCGSQYYCAFSHNDLLREILSSFCIEKCEAKNYEFFQEKFKIVLKNSKFHQLTQTRMVRWKLWHGSGFVIFGSKQEVGSLKEQFERDIGELHSYSLKQMTETSKSEYKLEQNLKISRIFNKIQFSKDKKHVIMCEDMKGVSAPTYTECGSMEMSDFELVMKRDKVMRDLCEKSPDIIGRVNNKVKGSRALIRRLKAIAIKFKEQFNKEELQQQMQRTNITKEIHYLSNIDILESNYEKFMKCCESFKSSWAMRYKIEIGNCERLRIENYSNKYKKVYLILSSYQQFYSLQSVHDAHIDYSLIKKHFQKMDQTIFLKPVEVKSEQRTILLYPMFELLQNTGMKEEAQVTELISTISQDKGMNFKVIICSLKAMKTIWQYQNKITNFIKFIVNEPIPRFPFLINEDCVVKVEKVGDGYEQGELKLVENIFLTCLESEYVVDGHTMTEIDHYNIAMMFAQDMPGIVIALNKKQIIKSHQEFIYFVYLNKLMLVKRSENRRFVSLSNANMSKEIIVQETYKKIQRAIKKCFLIGQKYLPIQIPFESLSYLSPSEIKHPSFPTNDNVLLYYYNKLLRNNKEEEYLVELNPSINLQYFKECFSRYFRLRFNEKKLKEKVESLEVGYGGMNKFRENNWVGFQCREDLCVKILKGLMHLKDFNVDPEEKREKKKYLPKQEMIMSRFGAYP